MATIRLAFLLVAAVVAGSLAMGQQLTGRLGTSVYTWKQLDTAGASRSVVRGYETFQLAVTQGNLSLQTAGTAAANLNDPFGQFGDVRFSNLFLRWKNIARIADLSLGRLPVFAGVGNGTVDGAMLKLHANKTFSIMGYGGANVRGNLVSIPTDSLSTSLKNNFFTGAQVSAAMANDLRFTVSYMNRRQSSIPFTAIRPDTLFNPVRTFVIPDAQSQQLAGVDARYEGWAYASLYGRYEYDLNFKRTFRAELFGRVPVGEALALTANYLFRQPNLLYNSYFSLFPAASNTEYEGGVEYAVAPSVWLFGKAAYVKYTDDNTQRYTAGLNSELFGLSYMGTAGYAGELTGVNAQVRYPLCERMFVPSAEVGYAGYKLSEYVADRQSVFSASAGGTLSLLQKLALNVQVQWLNNPFYAHDVRLFAKLDYWFSHNLHLLSSGRSTEETPHE